MNTYSASNAPLIINAFGEVDRVFNFSIGNDVEVYHSCSLTWHNELYVYGGNSEKTQISKVTACRLERVGELTFTHNFGDCVNVADEQIYLCFNHRNRDLKKCRVGSSPMGQFGEILPSHFDHANTRIATNNGKTVRLSDENMVITI